MRCIRAIPFGMKIPDVGIYFMCGDEYCDEIKKQMLSFSGQHLFFLPSGYRGVRAILINFHLKHSEICGII